jgi:hypothetical protein
MAAFCFLLITKALIEKSRGWIAGAIVGSILAPLIRGELIVIPIVVVIAILFAALTSDWSKRRRASWVWGDYVGFIVLAAGAIFLLSGIASHHSQEWYGVTTYWKHRAYVLGDWAVGSLAIGLGVIPLVAGLASLAPARDEEPLRTVRMFRCVATAAIIGFGLYTGLKAAYLSTVFATRVEERNLIYIAPLLFIGTALVLERRRVNLAALAAAAAYGLYLVVGTPYQMGVQLYSDALGFSILQQANRYYQWTPAAAQWLLIAILVIGVGLLAAVTITRRSGAVVAGIGAALAVGILGWNVTGEIAAAAGTVSISRDLEATLRHPFTWVDRVAKGKPTIYLAQGVADPNPEWELEFWNRSIVTVDSLDATLGGPGPSGTPNTTADGRVYWTIDPTHPGRVYDYAVEDWPCVDFAGPVAAIHLYRGGAANLAEWRLIKLSKPNRLRAECSGLYADGWSGPSDSTYFRFVSAKPGWLRIKISRENWPSSPVHVQLAAITTKYREPALGRVFYDKKTIARTLKTEVIWVRTPRTRFGARVVIVDKFVPNQIDPRISDPRTLGAQVDYRYFTKLPRGVKPHTAK